MADNVFLAEIVLPIAKWELMYGIMLKKEKILCVLVVWVVVYVLRFAQEVF